MCDINFDACCNVDGAFLLIRFQTDGACKPNAYPNIHCNISFETNLGQGITHPIMRIRTTLLNAVSGWYRELLKRGDFKQFWVRAPIYFSMRLTTCVDRTL